MSADAATDSDRLRASGLGESAVAEWRNAEQRDTADYDRDCRGYAQFWARADDLIRRLPAKPARSPAETAAAAAIFAAAREHRERFLRAHAEAVYERLTRNRSRFVRLDDLVFEASRSEERRVGKE